jgi:Short C-terminal domain
MFVGGIVLFNYELVRVLEIGTCASGNTPYQIARPCPAGTGTTIMLMMAGIFGGLIGAGIFAFRGDPPWAKEGRSLTSAFSWGTFAFGVFFTSTAVVCLVKALSDDNLTAGSKLGAEIVAGTFLLIGVPALVIALWGFVSGLGGRDERPATSAGPLGAGGSVSRMIGGLQRSSLASRGSPSGGTRWPWGSSGAGGGGAGDQIGKIERLQKLRESGAINDSEFEREKTKILAEG